MESKPRFKADSGLKLMEQVWQVLRYYRYAYRTEQTYCDWIIRFIRFHGSKRHPKDMGKSEVEGFLSHLSGEGKVSASTHRQALNAIESLYRDVLDQPIQGEIAPVRAKRHPRVPVAMTQGEVQRVLREMHGAHLRRFPHSHPVGIPQGGRAKPI
jgi:site-specific recombinase XerD